MNDLAQQWLTERASQSGTLAGALRNPDGALISHSLDPVCPPATVEKILADFDSLPSTVVEPAVPRWSTWAFESGQIRFVERPNGWRFVLIVRNETSGATALDSVSQEFLTVAFGSL